MRNLADGVGVATGQHIAPVCAGFIVIQACPTTTAYDRDQPPKGLTGDRNIGSRPDLRHRWVDRHLVWGAGTDLEHRSDAGSGSFDAHDGRARTLLTSTLRVSATGTPSSRGRFASPATRCWRPPSTPSHPQGASPWKSVCVPVSRLVAAPVRRRRWQLLCSAGLAALRLEDRSPRDIAYAAHRLEVDILAGQSGIQDQLSAAFGGINYIEIETYPEARVCPLPTWEDLNSRLTLVFVGRAHDSSAVHRQVIEDVASRGSGAFSRLRDAAIAARDALHARDLDAFGEAMIANTEAQGVALSRDCGGRRERVIELAAACGAVGWKVNGAGGDGGSVTILSADLETKEKLEDRVTDLDTRYQVLPIQVGEVGLNVRRAY